MSDTTKVYKSILSAIEIEKILLSVGNKLDKNSIVQDIDIGGVENVISAEVLKTALNNIIENASGDGLKAAINAADDCNVFSNTHKSALENMALRFVGTKSNITERDNTDVSGFIGGEVILLLANESEQTVFQYWDNATSDWRSASRAESRQVTANAVGAIVMKQYPKADFVALDVSIIGKTPSGDFHTTTARIGWKGDDIFVTSFGDLSNLDDGLFTITAESPTADVIQLVATTTVPTVNFYAEIVNMY